MKIKTIKKVLSKKLNHWLDSITDPILRSDTKKNLLVSGGSIASFLLNEEVNDYDIYIQDINVLKRLAKYYVKGDVLDGRERETLLKSFADRVEQYTKSGEEYCSEEYVRIKNLKSDQIKLNIPSAGIRFELNDEAPPYSPAFFSQNAISLTGDIQIVLRFSGTVEQIHKTFDYMHVTNYFTFQEGLVLNPIALESLLTKTLMYQGSLYPLTSIIRMKKFLGRGYTMSAGEILKILHQISQLDLNNIDILEDQLIGVDVAYFSTLIDILRNRKEKCPITSEYLGTIIDKVFNEYEEDTDSIKK